MAEAIGVVGSVIGPLQVTAAVALGLNSLIQDIHDAPDDILHIQAELATLAAVLGSTHELTERCENMEAPSLTETLKEQLRTCEKSMKDIQQFLKPLIQKELGGHKLIRTVEWDLKKSELHELGGRLSEEKAGLNLTVTSLNGVLEGKKQDEIKSDIDQIYNNVISDFKDIMRGEEFRRRIEEDVDTDSVRDGQSEARFTIGTFLDHRSAVSYYQGLEGGQGLEGASIPNTDGNADDLFQMDNPDAMLDAVRSQNRQLVRALISRGVGLTARSTQGFTVLHYCVFDNDVEMGELLIKSGAKVNSKDFHLRTPLQLALTLPSFEFAALLIENGCDVGDSLDELKRLAARDGEVPGRTGVFQALSRTLKPAEQCLIIHPAIRSGDVQSLTVLVESGFDPTLRNKDGLPLLFYALLHENLAAIKSLASHGADLNEGLPTTTIQRLDPNLPRYQALQGREGITPLHLAGAIMNNVTIVKLLLELGADPNNVLKRPNREISLIGVCARHYLGVATELLKAGANPNYACHDGRSAMYWAVFCENLELVKLLIERGGDAKYQWGRDGNTVVILAASKGRADIVRVLVDAGADIGVRNKEGETALDIAQRLGKREVTEFLQRVTVELEEEANA